MDSPLSLCSVPLVLWFSITLLSSCAGQHQVVSPSQPIVATVGVDIILPCHLEPAVDASDMTVEWTRPDLNPRFVHVWRDGVELESKKHSSYKGRTSLSINNLKHGDISLKLSEVKISDEGKYRCFLPTLVRESTVELVVGVVSFIVISLVRTEKDKVSSEMVLQCESKGWHPEPEMLWLDGEGNLLSVGPTETVRGPDDLYTVSSRVTVEQRHSNSFTCRVQQKNINQTRETHIHVPDDIFTVCYRTEAHITIFLAVGFLFFLAVFFVVCKWRQNKMKLKKVTDFNKKKTKSDQELQKKAEEQKDKNYVITTLKDHEQGLENLREKLKSQLEEVEREKTKNKKKLESIHTSYFNKDKVKIPLLEADQELDKRKAGLEECLKKAEEQLKAAEDVITRMTAGNTQPKDIMRREDEIQRKSEQSERGGK